MFKVDKIRVKIWAGSIFWEDTLLYKTIRVVLWLRSMFGYWLTGLLAFKCFIGHHENLIRGIFALVPKFYFLVKF